MYDKPVAWCQLMKLRKCINRTCVTYNSPVTLVLSDLFYFIYFIYLFASDTHNLGHTYPYQLLVADLCKTSSRLVTLQTHDLS